MTSQVVAAKPPIVAEIERSRRLIAEALPAHLNVERFARLALTTLRKTPALQNTTPESFLGALLSASALGLEPDVLGEAYLVPYGRECTLIIGYQGLLKLYRQHPQAGPVRSGVIYEKDEWICETGSVQRLVIRPSMAKDRGGVVAFWASVTLKNGEELITVLSPDQVAALRGKGAGGQGGIRDPEHWMERKTCIKQVLKLAPKSTQVDMALRTDEAVLTPRQVRDQLPADMARTDLVDADGVILDDEVEAELIEPEEILGEEAAA